MQLDFDVNLNFLKNDFLIGDVHNEVACHLLIATTDRLNFLHTAQRWYMDGTFHIVPNLFQQLYSIHAFVRQGGCMKQVSLVFMLMSGRRTSDYKAVLEKLLEVLERSPEVQTFCMDFESPLWYALRSLFLNAQLKGCVLHWGQVIFKRMVQWPSIDLRRARRLVSSDAKASLPSISASV